MALRFFLPVIRALTVRPPLGRGRLLSAARSTPAHSARRGTGTPSGSRRAARRRRRSPVSARRERIDVEDQHRLSRALRRREQKGSPFEARIVTWELEHGGTELVDIVAPFSSAVRSPGRPNKPKIRPRVSAIYCAIVLVDTWYQACTTRGTSSAAATLTSS